MKTSPSFVGLFYLTFFGVNGTFLCYNALEQFQKDWEVGKDNPESFIKYLLGTIISAYRDFEERVDIVSSNVPPIVTQTELIPFDLGYSWRACKNFILR